jgi:hypothetical protein
MRYALYYLTQVASYRHWIKKASRKKTIFSSKPLGVTGWTFFENSLLNSLKTISMYWRTGLPRYSSRADSDSLEFFLRRR